MSTSIQWTDEVWNPVTGCDKVSAGCAHCYAESFAHRQMGHWDGRAFTDVRCHQERVLRPLSWHRPRRVFITSMGDLWHPSVPRQFQIDVMGVVLLAHWLTFIDFTKRPEIRHRFMAAGDHGILDQMHAMQARGGISTRGVFRALDLKRRDHLEMTWPPPNYIAGVSIENQATADERIPILLQTPAAIRAVSAEPLLGPIDLSMYLATGYDEGPFDDILNWAVVGGESGPKARPCDLAWIRSIVRQCQRASVPVFVKQLGASPLAWAPTNAEREVCTSRGAHADPAEWPADLRVREYPEVAR